MKLTLSQWGELLRQISETENRDSLSKNLQNFVVLLRKYRMLGKLPLILRAWERTKAKHEGFVEASYEGKFVLNAEIRGELESIIKQKTGRKDIFWKEKENKKLLGGAKISFDGYLLDVSIQTKLQILHEAFKRI